MAGKLVGQVVLVEVVIDESKECVIGVPLLFRQQSKNAEDVNAAKESHENEGLNK